ncbi:MAG: HNH endonuclease, partial [Candidatus Marinimicrobia bacterium]|nr:HNH endonuclease [Candidatus Neomarinimicrobiota bacterium]
DIPKMYWRQIGKRPDKYEVVDGQQRLRTIWGFMSGDFTLGKTAEPINGIDLKNMAYKSDNDINIIPDEFKKDFDIYPLDIIIMTDTDEEEVREMFLRLQNGTSLKAQEKRNAMSGNIRDFVKQIASHKIFDNCKFDNSRYTYDLIAAQMIKSEIAGKCCNIKSSDLNKMYKNGKDFEVNGVKAKKVKRVLDFLLKIFPEKTPELERYSTLSLYIIVSYLLEKYVTNGIEESINIWFLKFEEFRRRQKKLDVESCDPEILNYHDRTSHSTDSEDSIQSRHDYLLLKYLEYNPSIQLKDENRIFSHEQRLAIYRKDQGFCQLRIKCDGKKCDWDNWDADHIIAWSNGGKTTVENGQVACAECNRSKGAN